MSEHIWSEILETGDPLVDKQHRDIHVLVEYVEQAEDHSREVLQVLDRLMQHVDCHFATEEALMARVAYDGAPAQKHRREHRELTQSARELVLQFRAGDITSTKPLAEFMRGWLATHVHEHDREFIAFVRARSVVAEVPEPWASNPPLSS